MIGMKHRDEIVELAAAQRVMYEMGARAGPQHDVGPPEIFRHLFALEHATVGDVAGDARLTVANHLVANFRPHSIAADQRAAFDGFAVVKRDTDAVTVVPVAIDPAAGLKRDQIAALARLQKGAMDVGAMGHAVRLAKALKEGVTERNIGDQFSGEGVPHFLGRRTVCVRQNGILQPDLFEDAKDVGAELDAGAHLPKFRRLFEQPYRKSFVRERVGRDQAADAAAGNEKGGGATIRTRHGITSIHKDRACFNLTIKPDLAGRKARRARKTKTRLRDAGGS